MPQMGGYRNPNGFRPATADNRIMHEGGTTWRMESRTRQSRSEEFRALTEADVMAAPG
ncbi:MAG: hypothetical protein JO042_15040 [Sinobacteraceae bacterium]|nr:hypothetical protein [Nevskiaceae bacterium]